MTAYANDPRVTPSVSGGGWQVEIPGAEFYGSEVHGRVAFWDGSWTAQRFDSNVHLVGNAAQFVTADDAIRSLIGEPQ